ncbi:aminotransferase class I/II-fold pyridoxal phosphate-dependent enzyme [Myxococcota bacterium]|nr:aminotransferase class I/II-fold pyridoxal phosphate-dependent enzyme [Myxococcota bacterium]
MRPPPSAAAQALNDTLARHHPAAAACLSPLGRSLFFPRGIPSQSAEARDCPINATIGQVTDGHGHALALPAILSALGGLDGDEAVLYTAQGGRRDLRERWAAHIAADAPGAPVDISLPVVAAGLTHGLELAAALFAGPDTPVLLPDPFWGNYTAIFERLHQARVIPYPLVRDARGPAGWLDVPALRRAIGALDRPAILVMNFPSNPLGYSPTRDEVPELVAAVADSPQPLTVICDDAYQGMWWEDEVYAHSLFHALAGLDPARVLAVKVDGATKELFYFGGRVAFLTFGAAGPAAQALEEKGRAIARATVSVVSSTSQAVMAQALADPTLPAQQATVRGHLLRRFQALKRALADAGLQTLPFNSGMFAVVRVARDPEEIRQALLREGVGVVALPEIGALRLSYGSVATEDIPRLVQAIARHAG